uniref:Uncharacterized protein n=1 Tax=Knipowitschia caucasica TaxID=637954 RepID=A0AAV2MPI7_KNICA
MDARTSSGRHLCELRRMPLCRRRGCVRTDGGTVVGEREDITQLLFPTRSDTAPASASAIRTGLCRRGRHGKQRRWWFLPPPQTEEKVVL